MTGKHSISGASVEEDRGSRTPSKKVSLNVPAGHGSVPPATENAAKSRGVVTPAGKKRNLDEYEVENKDVRRDLFAVATTGAKVTPSKLIEDRQEASPAKRKLIFGRLVNEICVKDSVRQVYKIVRKLTGSIGGNASFGPIYGELTQSSMQKMVNLMKEHTGFGSTSRFIDVGSGIGKPSLHVAQDPGVELSYGIEVETDRWVLGMTCLKGVLEAAIGQPEDVDDDERIGYRCIFDHLDIRSAKTLDPFSHVYMFSIGFPPELWLDLAQIWNRSASPYLICFHAPKDIIRSYEFQVELVAQTPTSMHGSKEGHMGYIYKRSPCSNPGVPVLCDPVFAGAIQKVNSRVVDLKAHVDAALEAKMSSGLDARKQRRRNAALKHDGTL